MIISALYIHPVKSMRGLKLEHCDVTPAGLMGDRVFAVVPVARDAVLTAREKPRMVSLEPTLNGNQLTLTDRQSSIVDHIKVDIPTIAADQHFMVWDDRVSGTDMGQRVAEWLSDKLGKPVRLIYAGSDALRASAVAFAPHRYVDLAPLLITTDESLAKLNEGLTTPIDQRRFRPNIVISGAPAPFTEDTWCRIKIGSVELEIAMGCARCSLPDIVPETADLVRNMPVNKALKTFREEADRQVYFGQNALVITPGRIAVGDRVEVLQVRDRQLLQEEGKAAYPA